MKKSLSPGVVILIVAVLVVVVGLIFWKGAGPGKNQQKIEDTIAATVVTGGSPMPNAPVVPAKK
ncbi:MAG: hypothetical protein ACYC27_20355 [Armatimonadota bacterium]